MVKAGLKDSATGIFILIIIINTVQSSSSSFKLHNISRKQSLLPNFNPDNHQHADAWHQGDHQGRGAPGTWSVRSPSSRSRGSSQGHHHHHPQATRDTHPKSTPSSSRLSTQWTRTLGSLLRLQMRFSHRWRPWQKYIKTKQAFTENYSKFVYWNICSKYIISYNSIFISWRSRPVFP